MGKIRRRTITIVITETWTIAWSGADDSLHPASNVLHMLPELEEKIEEEMEGTVDETLQSSLIAANPNPSQPTAMSNTPSDVTAASTGGKRKHTHSRHAGNPTRSNES
jgi:hypothetical protein